jgi:uncharacterized coiled-coil protein SlyX
MSNIDKMAQQFTSIEELQAYSEAQFKTITTLNSKINELQKELERVQEANTKLAQENAVFKVNTPKETLGPFSVTDEESICLIQIAMLKKHALERDLITDEVKRLEIYTKTLALIRGKEVQKNPKEKETANTKSEDLFKQLEELNKTDPQ